MKIIDKCINKHTTVMVFLLFVLGSSSVMALGVGNLELKSWLNQYLDATIPLYSVDESNIQRVKVNLASLREFEKEGLERPWLFNSFHFTPVLEDGKAFIKVQSDKMIRSIQLDFLVEINWPEGHIVKRFTLLLDPEPGLQ